MKRQGKKKETKHYGPERVILSDILPYETPIIFSNIFFYRFLTQNKIEITPGNKTRSHNIIWKDTGDEILEIILALLFRALEKNAEPTSTGNRTIKHKPLNSLETIPFVFKVPHKRNNYRQLSIIHPLNQVYLVWFYNEYKESIKYHSNISQYSIRKPYKIARYYYPNDYLHEEQRGVNGTTDRERWVEQHNAGDVCLRSFFTYEPYNSLHKFINSYRFHRSEKKYDALYQTDISQFFDSIYTHSIVWELYGKEYTKINRKPSEESFPGLFDRFMQNINYSETNGILIGSEFARIFAELLLQQIDKQVLYELAASNTKLIHRKDYEIFRYIDDYFIFYSQEQNLKQILTVLEENLHRFRLSFNKSKSISHEKPFVTPMTIAKLKIKQLLSVQLNVTHPDLNQFTHPDFNSKLEHKIEWGWPVKADPLITHFKIIIAEAKVAPGEILGYTTGTINNSASTESVRFKKDFQAIETHPEEKRRPTLRSKCKKCAIKYCMTLLEFLFFTYSMSPQANITIKLVATISKVISLMRHKDGDNYIFQSDEQDLIFKKIFDEIYLLIQKNLKAKYHQVDMVQLLIVLSTFDENYKLDQNILRELFLKQNLEDMDYFTITGLLFYIKDTHEYEGIKAKLCDVIEKKFDASNEKVGKSTELILLLFDLITCPYVSREFKTTLLKKHLSVNDSEIDEDYSKIIDKDYSEIIDKIIKFQKYWFVKWDEFDLNTEIEKKISVEVYA